MTMTDRLRIAADYMTEHGWVQGTERDNNGHVCLTGAIRYCAPVDGDTYLIRAVLRRRNRAEAWNDARGRTEDEVLNLLRTIEVRDSDLEATFGPQWAEIVALIRRAATLTCDDADQLVAAGGAAWDAARIAAWAAAAGAARGAAGSAAGGAAGSAAGGAAWVAAWDAARALVVRDLIGQYAFTQAHYDTLTKAWRTAIGPIHPDDND